MVIARLQATPYDESSIADASCKVKVAAVMWDSKDSLALFTVSLFF